MNKKVFIILLNWNNWPDTLACLASLKKIDYSDYQVVVVDNGSDEETTIKYQSRIEKERNRGNVSFLFNQTNLGFSEGNNKGIEYALKRGADYILLLNNDTVVKPDFLTKLVEAAEADALVGLVGPKIFFLQGPNKIWSAGGQINWLYNKAVMLGHGQIDQGQYDQITETEYLTGACLLAKRVLIEKIGKMSRDYFLYYEDTDWSLRARRAGFKCLYQPEAVVYHQGSSSTKPGSASYIYYHIRNGLILAQRFAPWYVQPFVHLDAFWRFLKQLIKWLIPSKRSWARSALIGFKDFYRGKRGKYEDWH